MNMSAALRRELYAEADCLHESGVEHPMECAAEVMIDALCNAAAIWAEEAEERLCAATPDGRDMI